MQATIVTCRQVQADAGRCEKNAIRRDEHRTEANMGKEIAGIDGQREEGGYKEA